MTLTRTAQRAFACVHTPNSPHPDQDMYVYVTSSPWNAPGAAGSAALRSVATVEFVLQHFTETDSECGSFRVWFLLLNMVTGILTYVAALHLKNKTAGYFISKMSLFRRAEELQFGRRETGQIAVKCGEQRGGPLLSRKKGGSWEELLGSKVHCRRGRAQEEDGFSLAELWWLLIG